MKWLMLLIVGILGLQIWLNFNSMRRLQRLESFHHLQVVSQSPLPPAAIWSQYPLVYSTQLSASEDDVTWSLVRGELPIGLTISVNGLVHGLMHEGVTDLGTYRFTLACVNERGEYAEQQFKMEVVE